MVFFGRTHYQLIYIYITVFAFPQGSHSFQRQSSSGPWGGGFLHVGFIVQHLWILTDDLWYSRNISPGNTSGNEIAGNIWKYIYDIQIHRWYMMIYPGKSGNIFQHWGYLWSIQGTYLQEMKLVEISYHVNQAKSWQPVMFWWLNCTTHFNFDLGDGLLLL